MCHPFIDPGSLEVDVPSNNLEIVVTRTLLCFVRNFVVLPTVLPFVEAIEPQCVKRYHAQIRPHSISPPISLHMRLSPLFSHTRGRLACWWWIAKPENRTHMVTQGSPPP
ncbi:hypothetical protein LENED_003786 [Lentinula edodes]|uniref:Uncharacterized protein n=1 Tax=Lentinula edodes TaxID=5353 RepID=A0A1Q3E4H5_LENED|nr:hypothetical protein LENED_003786 [Lentinula edodes]